jgi:hypothetical protein
MMQTVPPEPVQPLVSTWRLVALTTGGRLSALTTVAKLKFVKNKLRSTRKEKSENANWRKNFIQVR